MSPNNKKKLNLIRIKLDKLDNKLLSLIKYRTALVNEVLKLKEYKKEIIDQKRINFILSKIKGKSKKLDIDPKITRITNDNNASNQIFKCLFKLLFRLYMYR